MQVLIVDGSVQIIQRLEEMLADANIITAIDTSVCYDSAITLFNEKKPDIVLLGISFPANKSIKLLGEIKAALYKTSVIVLSLNMNEYVYEQCRLHRVDYCIDKYSDFEEIPAVIKGIARNNNKLDENSGIAN